MCIDRFLWGLNSDSILIPHELSCAVALAQLSPLCVPHGAACADLMGNDNGEGHRRSVFYLISLKICLFTMNLLVTQAYCSKYEFFIILQNQ